ncbi:MAG: hypothetical protein QXG44_08755 [Candidatus Jordarchaeaceae archaeon]
MSERTTGVLVGGAIALIGSVFGFWLGLALLGLSYTGSVTAMLWIVDPVAAVLASVLTPTVSAVWPWIVFTIATIALIFSIMLMVGKSIKISAIIVLIVGILSTVTVIFLPVQINWLICGILQLVGAIVALATGALE